MPLQKRLTALILAFLVTADVLSSVSTGVEPTRTLVTTVFRSEALAAPSMMRSLLGHLPAAWAYLTVLWRECRGEIRIPGDELPDEAYTGTPAKFIGARMASLQFSQKRLAEEIGGTQPLISQILRNEHGMSKAIATGLARALQFDANKFWDKVYLPHAAQQGWTTRENRVPRKRTKGLPKVRVDYDKRSLFARTMTQSRRDKGISQSDLAKDLGIAQHQLSNWETDQHLPHWAITVRWCLSLSMAPMTIKLLDPRWITLDDAAFMALWQSTAKAVRHAEEARRRLGEAAADYPGGIDALAAVMGVSPIKLREMFDWKSFQNIQWYFDVASYLKLSSLAWLMPGFEIGDQATLLRDFQASLRSLEVRKGIKSSRILGISDSTFWHRMSQLKAGRIAIIDFFELLFSVADSIEEFVAVFPEVSNKPRTKRLRGTTAAERMLLEALEAAPPSSQQLRLVEAMENFKKSEPRNAEILRLYLGVGVHGAGMERSELAKRYGRDGKDLSKERIRQVVQSSIKKIYAEAGIMAPQNPPVPNRKSSPRRHRQNARPVREVAATA